MRLEFDKADLKPLVEAVVSEVLEQAEADRSLLGGQLAFAEAEAAAAIGVVKHVLRDCRLRGEIIGSKVGNKTVYLRSELLNFLARRRTD